MQKATLNDRSVILDILSKTFTDNKSVNYIIKQDDDRIKHIKQLCAYSFNICSLFGEVFISDDRKACALILLPDKKKITLRTLLLDLKLVFSTIGLGNISKTMKREKLVKKSHPKTPLYHIWYIGVDPQEQGKGIGSILLNDILQRAQHLGRVPVLETSTQKNISWYQKHGFTIYNELHFGFTLYCMKA